LRSLEVKKVKRMSKNSTFGKKSEISEQVFNSNLESMRSTQ
jgi:hypothetical protein